MLLRYERGPTVGAIEGLGLVTLGKTYEVPDELAKKLLASHTYGMVLANPAPRQTAAELNRPPLEE